MSRRPKTRHWTAYVYVRAWCRLHGEFPRTERLRAERAALDDVDTTACYRESDDGGWVSVNGVADAALRERLAALAAEITREETGIE